MIIFKMKEIYVVILYYLMLAKLTFRPQIVQYVQDVHWIGYAFLNKFTGVIPPQPTATSVFYRGEK